MTAELVLRWSGGELDLMGWNDSEFGEFRIDALADGTDWGNPEPVRRTLRRFLADGSSSVKDYDDNRTIPLSLRVTAADGVALAGGEQALDLIDGRRCELVWTPPDEFSAAAMFKLDHVDLRHKFDDFAEVARRERFYSLTASALPHAYSAEYVTIPAVAQGASTPTLVDNCNSLTGWSSPNGTLENYGDSVIASFYSAIAVRLGTVDLTTQPYLAVQSGVGSGLFTIEARSGAGAWETLPRIGADGSDTVFDGSDLSNPIASELRFTSAGSALKLGNIEKQATPSSSPGRQQVRVINTPGSRRSPASLLVESPEDGLGTVLIYSGPSYNPDLTRGATHVRFGEGSAPLLSGGDTSIPDGGVKSFEVLASDLPEGDYSVWVRALCGSESEGGTLTITPVVLSVADDVIATLPAMPVAIPALTDVYYHLLLAGSASLPYATLPPGSSAKVRFDCAWDHSDPGQGGQVDALLAFNRTHGTLAIAEAGEHKKLWIDSSSLDLDRPSVFVGDDDKADAVPLGMVTQLPAWSGAHVVTPPETYLYVGSTNAHDVEVSGTFRPAHHTHPTS